MNLESLFCAWLDLLPSSRAKFRDWNEGKARGRLIAPLVGQGSFGPLSAPTSKNSIATSLLSLMRLKSYQLLSAVFAICIVQGPLHSAVYSAH